MFRSVLWEDSSFTRLRIFRLLLVLLVASLGLFLVPPGILPVHAISPSYVKTVVGSQSAVTVTGVTAGDFLGVAVFASSFGGGFLCNTITDSAGDSYTVLWTNQGPPAGCPGLNPASGNSAVWWTTAKTGGSITITISCTPGGCTFSGGTAWADLFTNVAAVLGGTTQGNCGGSCPVNNGQDSVQSSITAGSGTVAWEAMGFTNQGSGAGVTLTAASATSDGIAPAPQTSNNCGGFAANQLCSFRSSVTSNFPIFRVNYAGSGGSSTISSHGDVILLGGSSPTTTSNTSCFGNCGSPAITLINPNATHPVNFNSSVTMFYAFQSPLNGFILNITTNLARGFPNGEQIGLAAYVANCPVNVQPFTAQCQGVSVSSAIFFFGQKGRASITSNAPIKAGQWIAIGFSAQFSGTDLNETNSVCNTACFDSGHLQYTSGFTPALLSGVSRCASTGTPCNTAGIDQTALWAFLSGSIASSGVPPPSGPCTNNFAQLDCMIPAMVNGLCSVVTASCQTSTALLWIIILSFTSFLLLTVGFASAHVTKFVAAGDVFMFLFLGWFFIFAGLGVLQSFVIIFFLFIGAVAFGKTARNYF